MKVLVSTLAIVAGLLLIGMGYTLTLPTDIQKGDYDVLKDLKFIDQVTGSEVSLDQFLGTPVVVNLWVSWNSYCQDELINFEDLQKQYGAQVKFVVINNGEKDELAKAFVTSHPEVLSLKVWLDPQKKFFEGIKAKEVPDTIFIDKTGRVVKIHYGRISSEQIKHSIEALIFE